ncbi:hypothetical protein PFICI_11508 [Pestalotiopsis fici W106-1]|uniref:Heterokaryon incompatibility domain-containing protein n=1 Tax=Pestalotiopsis fici (strain W106-1 / CGMCC3.15140) TaxID=1229662 RepID=W3WTG0_PESFW|nr:uncharacterized protein PFICI_11508 [Pestalotiopsis fici W106-1]ETS76121.1 hypothetical protein PFICI_11508 [Pestalotiopsis fici W106-1]
MDRAYPSDLYTPLNEAANEIRLLTFEDSSSRPSRIHCRLTVHSLDSISDSFRRHLVAKGNPSQLRRKDVIEWAVQSNIERNDPTASLSDEACHFEWGCYDTLSYVWGSKISRERIVVNGHKVSATENLVGVLRNLSKTGQYRGRHRLWVDALCINQTDEREKTSQIKKMRYIYSVAWRVVSWLGEDGNASNAAFDLLEKFADIARQVGKPAFGELPLPSGLFFGDYFYGLNELMQRPYWSRLWIVQELVLGSSSVVLRCGERVLGWKTFCSGINILNRADMWVIKDQLLKMEHKARGLGGSRYHAVFGTLYIHLVHKDIQVLAHYEETQGGGNLSLRRLLDIACGSDCTDMRDKVFSLLGMMEPQIASTVVHDYSNPPSTLFATVTRSFITHYNDLEPLREGNPWSRTGTPSWAADWTWDGRLRYSRPETPLWGFWNVWNEQPIDARRLYRAAGDKVAQYTFIDEKVLKCRGFVVDVVTGLGAVGSGYFAWDASATEQCLSWQSIYGGPEETAIALYKTLVLDCVVAGQPAEDRHAAILHLPRKFSLAQPQFHQRQWQWMASQRGYYFRWQLWRAAHDEIVMGNMRLGDFFSDELLDGATEQDYAEVYGGFDRTGKERRFMLTERGYLGWAPDNIAGGFGEQTRRGDLICIIFGCSTPLIIRPTISGQYLIVGEAYVHGLMRGEALDFLDAKQCHVQDFTFV